MSDVTRILSQIEEGDPQAAEKLLPLVYEELRKLAAVKLAQERPGQTLQATALVHEAWIRLVGGQKSEVRGQKSEQEAASDLRPPTSDLWHSRGHFFAAAAEAMRRILVEQARRKAGPKAGGDLRRVELSPLQVEAPGADLDILALNEALSRLEGKDPRAAELIKLRFFAGMTIEQAAAVLGISISTAKSDWTYAKNWLRADLQKAS
jgi:RNA polymerase sigma factor (TIGR02999 family)